MHQSTLTHVRLLVEEYAACFAFYRDVLGVEPTFGDAESGYADFETGDVTLALFAAEEMAGALAARPPATDGRDQVCLVLRVADVDETATDLRNEGLELAAAPTDHPEWGLRTVHVRDPDGTLIEFNEPLAQ
jgi:predicted enzyme related to lactoylglutathione lyase